VDSKFGIFKKYNGRRVMESLVTEIKLTPINQVPKEKSMLYIFKG
jgi:hypothetical protein